MNYNKYIHGIKNGYRSGLEERICDELKAKNIDFQYETIRLPFIPPIKQRTYTPDIILPNGLIIELKGRFMLADRQKHLHIKEQYPTLDLRFVFQNPNQKISKTSKTTYMKWCNKYGFKFAKDSIPQSWIDENDNKENLRILKKIKENYEKE